MLRREAIRVCLSYLSQQKFQNAQRPKGKDKGWRSHGLNLGGVVVIERVCGGISDVEV